MMLRRNPNHAPAPATAPVIPDAPLPAAELAQVAHNAIDDIGASGYAPQKAAAAAHIALDKAIAAAAIDTADAAIAAAYGASSQAAYQAGANLDDSRRMMLRDMAATIAKDRSVKNAATPADAIAIAAGLGVAAGARLAQNWQAQDGGYADAFGLDPAARQRSWEGYHDGAAD